MTVAVPPEPPTTEPKVRELVGFLSVDVERALANRATTASAASRSS